MSDLVKTRQLETNWNAIQAANPRQDGQVTIVLKPSSDDLFWSFDISVPKKRECGGHLTLKYGFNPAHVTLNGWDGARKTNYWYEVDSTPNQASPKVNSFTPSKKLQSDVPDTSVPVSQLPGDIKDAIMRLLSATYANCF